MTERKENVCELLARFQREGVHMEMDGATFQLLETILTESFALDLLVTRASVSEKIVAVIKKDDRNGS